MSTTSDLAFKLNGDLTSAQLALLPNHGGDMALAASTWGLEPHQCLDLSTGINPTPYPLSAVPEAAWHNLPYEDYGLREAAKAYYAQAVDWLTPGSQMVIETLPLLLPKACVALPDVGYNEYAKAWQAAGHEIEYYRDYAQLLSLLREQQVSHCVIINPNNPSGLAFSPQEVLAVAALCLGFCIVDEAFRDLTPQASVLPFDVAKANNLIVLRSLGKFFGLAGARLGFVFMGLEAQAQLGDGLAQRLSLWGLAGPSLWGATQALKDAAWQQDNRQMIGAQSEALATLLERYLAGQWSNQGLFLSAYYPAQAGFAIYQALAQQGIFIRYFHLPKARCLLRFGLANASDLARVEAALAAI